LIRKEIAPEGVNVMLEIRFLFRFRDLVAPTIQEHQLIIQKQGWCWWGWWKRPSEDSRSDIWDDLAQRTTGEQPVEVGLFDSGSGDVYRATVTQVIKPAHGGRAENTINVPATTTIWRIRPSSPSDLSEQILLSIKALSEPISSDVVPCKSDKILHLTDLHFAAGTNRDQHVWRYDSETGQTRHTLVEAITTALGDERKIGLLVISGDFTFIGSAAEFDEARTAITHLLGILDLSRDQR
jgi:hypothetical protein